MKSLIILLLVLSNVGCSQQMDSCLDDGLSMVQVQEYLAQDRREELLNQLQIRANNGEVAAQYFLGFIHWSDDPQESISWFKKSAENGCQESALYLAQSYIEGEVVDKDEQQAFHWYMRLANAGDSSAMRMVSHMYKVGQGVDKDVDQAHMWATKSWQ